MYNRSVPQRGCNEIKWKSYDHHLPWTSTHAYTHMYICISAYAYLRQTCECKNIHLNTHRCTYIHTRQDKFTFSVGLLFYVFFLFFETMCKLNISQCFSQTLPERCQSMVCKI